MGTLALEVLLHQFHVLSALTRINLGSLHARVARRVTLLVVLVRPRAVTALHALDTPLFMLGHRVVFAQLLAAMPAITCLMDHALLATLDSIRARLDNPLAIHAQLATPQRGLVPRPVVVAAPAVQVITSLALSVRYALSVTRVLEDLRLRPHVRLVPIKAKPVSLLVLAAGLGPPLL